MQFTPTPQTTLTRIVIGYSRWLSKRADPSRPPFAVGILFASPLALVMDLMVEWPVFLALLKGGKYSDTISFIGKHGPSPNFGPIGLIALIGVAIALCAIVFFTVTLAFCNGWYGLPIPSEDDV